MSRDYRTFALCTSCECNVTLWYTFSAKRAEFYIRQRCSITVGIRRRGLNANMSQLGLHVPRGCVSASNLQRCFVIFIIFAVGVKLHYMHSVPCGGTDTLLSGLDYVQGFSSVYITWSYVLALSICSDAEGFGGNEVQGLRRIRSCGSVIMQHIYASYRRRINDSISTCRDTPL